MSSDAQIAREWAAGFIKYAGNAQIVDADELTAARYILATTTAPTMADIAWDDAVHAGLCAEHHLHGVVLMIAETPAGDISFLFSEEGRLRSRWTDSANLTPIPGTKIDLTPRREPEPESTPSRPEVLETEEDYKNAPEGTVVAVDHCLPRVKDDDGFWMRCGDSNADANSVMSSRARRVLRWGRKA